ncbi:MAG: NAD(P)H-dependent oxidoreductase [Burkholderiales bacterium]|nr:NAD(P)H-dependent oxidoreductase [Burkholderiales bacterium]
MQKKKILILDCGTRNSLGMPALAGDFNHWFSSEAKNELESMGHEVALTRVADPYDPNKEAEKIRKADAVIVQTPVWWLSTPWTFKKYEDEVFARAGLFNMVGKPNGSSSGEDSADAPRKEGQYLISSTWNSSEQVFKEKGSIMEGTDINSIFLPIHKVFQLLGMKPLQGYAVLDIYGRQDYQDLLQYWKEHLKKTFG